MQHTSEVGYHQKKSQQDIKQNYSIEIVYKEKIFAYSEGQTKKKK